MELEPVLKVLELVLYNAGFADGDFKFEVAKLDFDYVLGWRFEEGRREFSLCALNHLGKVLFQVAGYSQCQSDKYEGRSLALDYFLVVLYKIPYLFESFSNVVFG